MSTTFKVFEQQIKEERNQIKALQEAFDIIADQLTKCEQREREKDAEIERLKNQIIELQNDNKMHLQSIRKIING
jgi:hypothetical protein